MNLSTQRNYTPWTLFSTAVVFILLAPVFWLRVEAPGAEQTERTYEHRTELYQQVCPDIEYGFGRLRAGEIPLWNPRQLCGAPFFANPAHGLLQPLNVVFLMLELPRALALHAFLALSLMGFFFVLFARTLGVRHLPAILGGIVYTFCGASAAAMSLPAYANALVWLPLVYWALRTASDQGGVLPVALGTLATSFLLLSGALALPLVLAGFFFVYSVCSVLFGQVSERPTQQGWTTNRWRRAQGPLVIFALTLLLTSIQWIPTLAWALTLESPGALFTRFAVPADLPRGVRDALAQVLQARSSALPALGYVGVSTLLLVPAAFFHVLPRWERTFLGIAALGLSAGAMLSAANGTGHFPYTVLIYPALFCLATLAALGADRLFAARSDPHSPRLWGPLLFVLIVFIVIFVIAPAPTRGRMAPLGAALVLFALFRTRWAGAAATLTVALFLFIDLSASSVNYGTHPFFRDDACTSLSQDTASLLHETALDDRVLVSATPGDGALHPNIGMNHGLRVAGAAGLPLTRDQAQWWDALAMEGAHGELNVHRDFSFEALLNVMAVRAVAAPADGGLTPGALQGLRLRRRGTAGGVAVYANETVMPRIYWVPSWRLALDMTSAMEALCTLSFDPYSECVIASGGPGVSHLARTVPDSRAHRAGPALTEPAPKLRVSVDDPEHIVIEVDAASPGILVLSDSHAPGWRGVVAGNPAPILQVNGLFRGIALPAGNHTVTFSYRPRSVLVGMAITATTICALAIGVLAGLLLRLRRARATTQ